MLAHVILRRKICGVVMGESSHFETLNLQHCIINASFQRGGGAFQVEIMNHQHYIINPQSSMAKWLFPGKVELDVQSVITVDLKAKQIVNHAENWQGKSAPPEFVRKASGGATCMTLKMAGLQKEIDVSSDTPLTCNWNQFGASSRECNCNSQGLVAPVLGMLKAGHF